MIQVIKGKIKQYSLPKTGTLKNGSTVSGYHLLDEEILLDEGWLPLEDKVIKKYRIEDIPEPQEPQPSEIDLLNERLNTQDAVIEEILFEIIPTIMEV